MDSERTISQRADELFRQHQREIYERTDRMFARLMVLQYIGGIVGALWLSPLTWSGAISSTHANVWLAVGLGGVIAAFPVVCAYLRPGAASTRHAVALAQVMMSALFIHISGGRIETHFHIFGSLAFIAFYRDITLFLPATLFVAADHLLRGMYWPESVYGILSVSDRRWVEHAAWVLFEDTFLVIACTQSIREMRSIAWHRARLEVANEATERTVATRTAELRASEKRALATLELKSQFLANVSHEIRTPINVVIGMTDMALDTSLTPEQRDYLTTIRSSSCALLGLLNDVLDLSKIEAGRLTLEAIRFSLRDALADMLRPYALRAEQKDIDLVCVVPPEVPDALVGDPGRLRQIIVNLVGNAIKFTTRGAVIVRVGVERAKDAEVALHVAVEDTGIGIAEDKQSVIFAPFVQADGSMSRLYGGSGLGLAIVSQLVEAMAGRVWLESEVGRGSTFHFTAGFATASRTSAGKRARDSRLRGVHILLLDDHVASSAVIAGMLAECGADIRTRTDLVAPGGEPARPERFPRRTVALVDIQFGRERESEARTLALELGRAGIPIVLLTAGQRPVLWGSGCVHGYVPKPVFATELVRAIESALESGATATPPRRRRGGWRPRPEDELPSLPCR